MATDALFGTRMHTDGAQMQLPRKIPLRIEPKTYLANERTFLSWVHMAVTLGGFSTVLSTLAVPQTDPTAVQGAITPRTTQFISLTLIPVALCMLGYAIFTYQNRVLYLKRKEVGFYNDQLGPAILCILVMISLTMITILTYTDVLTYHAVRSGRT